MNYRLQSANQQPKKKKENTSPESRQEQILSLSLYIYIYIYFFFFFMNLQRKCTFIISLWWKRPNCIKFLISGSVMDLRNLCQGINLNGIWRFTDFVRKITSCKFLTNKERHLHFLFHSCCRVFDRLMKMRNKYWFISWRKTNWRQKNKLWDFALFFLALMTNPD